MSADDPGRVASFVESEGIGYALLSDPGAAAIRAWGIKNETSSREIPHPSTFVVDRQGIVRWEVVNPNYQVRPPAQEVLEAVRGLPPADAP